MKIDISHQKPEGITHATVERWQRHVKRSQKVTMQLEKVLKRIEIVRLVTVLLLVAIIISLSEQSSNLGTLLKWVIVIALVSIFIYLLKAHRKYKRRKNFLYFFSDYYSNALNRRKRKWAKIETINAKPNDKSTTDVFYDLGITGSQASLAKLFSMMNSSDAWEKWFSWLSSPAIESKIKARQSAVQELMEKRRLLLRFLHISSQYKTKKAVRTNLVNWLSSDETHDSMFSSFVISIILVIVFWVVTISVLFQIIPLWSFIIVCVANLLMTAVTMRKTDQLFTKIEGLRSIIESMKSRIDVIKKHSFSSEYLQDIEEPLIATKNPAIASLHSIQRLSLMAEFRRAGIFYFLLQLTFLWNVLVYTGISRWHKKYRKNILKSYESLTTFEVLISTACFSLENNEFTFPEQTDLSEDIQFEKIAHPLLSYEQRIANDLDWSNTKPMLLISGSNMAGKSTFMKAIGLNILLSRLGAPICAKGAIFPMVNIKSVINVEDSLAEGDSYFMVELKRLVSITQAGESYNEQGKPIFSLCLFDEVMSGTNSDDRTEIFKAIVEVLKDKKTFAIFSTHDMKLTDYAKSTSYFSLYEFSEQYKQLDDSYLMHFDYQLKEGVSNHTNAQNLLKMLGLDTAREAKPIKSD